VGYLRQQKNRWRDLERLEGGLEGVRRKGGLLDDLDELLGLVEGLDLVVVADELVVDKEKRIDTALAAGLPDPLALLGGLHVAVDDLGIALDEALDDVGHLKGLLGDKHAASGAGVDDDSLAHG